MSEWNPFAGEVLHLDKTVQLQTYRLPWPFASREYLVRCSDVRQGKSVLEAHCASIDEHPSAPLRSDRVRGRSETVWRFTEDKEGETSIHLETLVDPRGGLPSWVVDKAGKSAAVKIVRALIHHTTARYQAHKAKGGKGAGAHAQGDGARGGAGVSASMSASVWRVFGNMLNGLFG